MAAEILKRRMALVILWPEGDDMTMWALSEGLGERDFKIVGWSYRGQRNGERAEKGRRRRREGRKHFGVTG